MAGGLRNPALVNIKVANVTWHDMIHIDYYHTAVLTRYERSQRVIYSVVCRQAHL